MSPSRLGTSVPFSPQRRLVGDLLHFARKVPSVPVQRRMDLAPVVAARDDCPARPSWVAVFAKAYSIVAREDSRLRRAYLGFPYPRLYEHAESIASIAFAKDYRGEEGIFFAQLRAPDRQTLAGLDAHVRRYKSTPVEEIAAFRQALRVSRLPRPLRRFAWWYGLNVSGQRRARNFGTFGVSVYSGLGVESLHPLSPLTTVLNYGPIDTSGRLDVRIIYDHRVLDGATVGRALIRLEEVLRGPIAEEMREQAQACELAGELARRSPPASKLAG